MAGRGATNSIRPGGLPLGLAAFSIALSLLLFLTGTVPALREARDLERTEQQNIQDLTDLLGQTRDLRQRQQALDWDPQTVLMEIDRLGLVPDELLEDFPQPK